MNKRYRHLHLVTDERLTQQTCPHLDLELEQQAGRDLLVCLDCGDVLETDIPVFTKHG